MSIIASSTGLSSQRIVRASQRDEELQTLREGIRAEIGSFRVYPLPGYQRQTKGIGVHHPR